MKVDDQILWEDHIKALANSGLSRAEYCREHGLNYGRLFRWQRRLAEVRGKKPRAFVRAKPASAASRPRVAPAPAGVRLTIGEGTAIEFPASADPRWIAEPALAIGRHSR